MPLKKKGRRINRDPGAPSARIVPSELTREARRLEEELLQVQRDQASEKGEPPCHDTDWIAWDPPKGVTFGVPEEILGV